MAADRPFRRGEAVRLGATEARGREWASRSPAGDGLPSSARAAVQLHATLDVRGQLCAQDAPVALSELFSTCCGLAIDTLRHAVRVSESATRWAEFCEKRCVTVRRSRFGSRRISAEGSLRVCRALKATCITRRSQLVCRSGLRLRLLFAVHRAPP